MFDYLKLVRFPNLILIALTQGLVRYCIVLPAFRIEYLNTGVYPPHQSKWEFSLLVLSTVLLAAAGYIINDVFDIHTDEINKPGRNIIGKKLSEKSGRTLYLVLSAVAIILGFYLALRIDKPVMGFIQVFSAASLWIYSTQYKRKMLSGNVIVSFLCALVLLTVALYEPGFYLNIFFVFVYATFAFLVSMVREIIKDIEDVEGDELSQYKTLPIRMGILTSKMVIYFIIALTIGLLIYFFTAYFYHNKVISYWNLLAISCIPFSALAYWIFQSEHKKDFTLASRFTKGILVAGILSMIPFYYFFLR